MASRALFLDRDGVINIDKGYVYRIADFIFVDGIFELCRVARDLGYLIVVVTNQSGIGRGFFSEADYQNLTRWMCECFTTEGVALSGVYHCPYHPEATLEVYRKPSDWRKPAPGMLLQAAADLALDLGRSVMIGDKEDDVIAARAAGLAAAIRFADPRVTVSHADSVYGTFAEISDWLKIYSK